jgi:hypothetical protein
MTRKYIVRQKKNREAKHNPCKMVVGCIKCEMESQLTLIKTPNELLLIICLLSWSKMEWLTEILLIVFFSKQTKTKVKDGER